jgi:hypothetical protein
MVVREQVSISILEFLSRWSKMVKLHEKRYLGDGVYIRREKDFLVLTTENGISVTNQIVLEAEPLGALIHYLEIMNYEDEDAQIKSKQESS